MKIIDWFKTLRRIVRSYDNDYWAMRQRIEAVEAMIKDRTDVGVDIGFQGHTHVTVIGRYKGADFIQAYSIGQRDLTELIKILREMEKFGTVRTVDAPPNVKAVVMRSLAPY